MMLKLLSYNIRFGGQDRGKKISEVINFVAPDIVVFQEAYTPGVIEQIAAETNLKFVGAREAHSIAFVSKIEVADFKWHRPAGSKHSFLEIVLADNQTRIFGLHLKPRFSKRSRISPHNPRDTASGFKTMSVFSIASSARKPLKVKRGAPLRLSF